MGLFSPIWMTAKESKKSSALSFTERADQSTLARIAREAPLLEVKIKAINRIKDQVTLRSIADDKNLPDELRSEAMKKIIDMTSDEQTLFSLVKGGTLKEELRILAARKIKEQAMVESMIRDNSLPTAIRATALNNADSVTMTSDSDQKLLRQMAREEKDNRLRIAAINNIIPAYAEDLLRTLRDTVPELKVAACSQLNHELGAGWDDGKRLPDGRICYQCEICGAIRIDRYEILGNTDSV